MVRIISVGDAPELLSRAAKWFASKWRIPEEAYRESMCRAAQAQAVPAWYLALDTEGEILGGLGVIENDFHRRPDLTPNLCAFYIEPESRGQGIGRALLAYACAELHANGVEDVYLITDHTSLYEKFGWDFFCMVEENDGGRARMYHRKTAVRPETK